DPIENDIRSAIRAGMARGHVQIHVTFTRAASDAGAPLNRNLMAAYIAAFREAAALHGVGGAMPDLNSALRLPGMIGIGDEDEWGEEVTHAVLEAARDAVAAINQVREREGAATAQELRERCQTICGLVGRMDEIRAGAVPAFQRRLREKLGELLAGAAIDPQRLGPEAALLTDRRDRPQEPIPPPPHPAPL